MSNITNETLGDRLRDIADEILAPDGKRSRNSADLIVVAAWLDAILGFREEDGYGQHSMDDVYDALDTLAKKVCRAR